MALNEADILSAAARLKQAKRILLVSHSRPDGDSVGSLIGLGLALQQVGKTVQMVIEDGVPASLRFLEGADQVVKKAEGSFDLVITLDCSDLGRIGDVLKDRPAPDVNIDHHVTNNNFASINLVDPGAGATAQILVDILPRFGLQLSMPAAAGLLTGLITDTIGFRTSNVTPATFYLAARLLESGVDLPEIYRRALTNHSFEAVRYWGAGLSNLERDDRLVWTTLSLSDRKEARYPGRDDADLINIISAVDDFDVSIIFIEQADGIIKVSWRAKPGFDISNIAMEFGGGGHPAASGAEIAGSMAEVKKIVLDKTRSLLIGGHHVQ
jgi:phosphoesterase RecJ-like protein